MNKSEFVTNMTWGEDPSDLYRNLRLTLRGGEKARIAVLDETVYKALVHFSRFYFYCIGADCPFCAIKPPSPRYLTWVFQYNLDAAGRPTNPVSGSIKAWMYGRDKYTTLSGLKSEYGDLRSVDLLLECNDEKFQKFSIVPARDCLWQKDEENAKRIIAQFKESRVDPVDLIARTQTREQIQALMGQAGGSPAFQAPTAVVGPREVSDVSNEAQASLQDLLSLLSTDSDD